MLDYNEFAPLFGDWAGLFQPFIEGEEMEKIYQKLKSEKEKIVPSSDVTFRSFAESSPHNIKSVWYLMDPYPKRYKDKTNQATGIPLDCSNSKDHVLQPSLQQFWKGLMKDTGKKVEETIHLDYLLDQGILLLNTDLTCKLNKTGSHSGLWDPFQKFFLEQIMGKKTGIIYVLAGKESHKMEKYITPIGNYIWKTDHPMAAEHRHTEWDAKKVFTKTNQILTEHKKDPIEWDRSIFYKDLIENCPF